MVVRLSFTLDEYDYYDLLAEIQGNRSSYIRKCLKIAQEQILNDNPIRKSQLTNLLQENENLKMEVREMNLLNAKLKADLVRYKELITRRQEKEEQKRLEEESKAAAAIARGLKNAGVLR